MANAREVLALVIRGDGSGAISEMKRVGATARTELGSAEAQSTRFLSQSSAALIATGAATAAAGGAVLVGAKKASDAYVNVARDALKLQRVTGETAEESSRLRFAAQQSGVGVDQLSTAFVRLSKNASTDAGTDRLRRLGISLKDANGQARPLGDVLEDLAAIMQTTANGSEKNALAVQLFGRAGADLLPLLNRGRQGIRDLKADADSLGLTFSQADLDGVRQYVAAQRQLQAAQEGLKVTVGRAVFPAVADGLNRVASTAQSASQFVAGLPPELRATAGSAVTLGSAFVVAAGAGAVLVGSGSRIMATYRGVDGQLTRTGVLAKGLGLALAGAFAVDLVFRGVNSIAGFEQSLEDSVNDIIANSGRGQDALQAFSQGALDEARKIKASDAFTWPAAELGVLGQQMIQLPSIDEAVPSSDAQAYIDRLRGVSLETTQALLDAWGRQNQALPRNSEAYRNNQEFIDRNQRSVRRAVAAQDEMGAATEDTTGVLDAQTQSLQDLARAAVAGEITYRDFAEARRQRVGVVLDVADAEDRLAEAQRRLGQIARGETPEVVSATRRLADAQQRLNDVLRDDPTFGLVSQSPQAALADARNRLADANARLAANPDDPFGQTMRDEALSDLELANRRNQDAIRDAEARARSLRDANQGVADARRELGEARENTGPNSQAYEDAARQVIRSQGDMEVAQSTFADQMKRGDVAIEEVNAELDRLAQKGGPTAAAVSQIRGELDGTALAARLARDEIQLLAGVLPFTPPTGDQVLQRQGRAGPEDFGPGARAGRDRAASAFPGLPAAPPPSTGSLGFIEFQQGRDLNGNGIIGRDAGGRMVPGQRYQMAENRPELFIPDRPGTTIPDLGRFIAGAQRRADQEPLVIQATINQQVPRPEMAGAAVVETLRNIAFRAGKGLRVPVA